MKKLLFCVLVLVLFLTGCSTPTEPEIDGVQIKLSDGMERPEKPDGERHQMPNGEMPQGERPEMPEGFTPPEMQNGERPEKPEGAENMTPPENMGGAMGGFTANGETSTVFTIVKGGNQFANVGPATN